MSNKRNTEICVKPSTAIFTRLFREIDLKMSNNWTFPCFFILLHIRICNKIKKHGNVQLLLIFKSISRNSLVKIAVEGFTQISVFLLFDIFVRLAKAGSCYFY